MGIFDDRRTAIGLAGSAAARSSREQAPGPS